MAESQSTPELKRALLAVLERTTAAFAEHPDPDRLFAYSAGGLSAEEEESIRDHLSLCRDCVDRLWLDPEDPLARERHGVVDLETERAWRETVARIREIVAGQRLARERRRSRFYQIAAAACLVVAAGLAWRAGVTPPPLSPDVSGPTVNVGIYDVTRSIERSGAGNLDPAVSEGGPEETALAVSEKSFTLVFLLESGDFDRYELKILDDERNEIWTSRSVLVRDDQATLSLSRADFPAGRYFVEIYCWSGDRATVWAYPIRLSYM